MIDREIELQEIEKYIKENGVTFGSTAFVCRTQQVDPPERIFIHSNVVKKFKWGKSSMNYKDI